jgi:hypothetical protein
MDEYVVVVFPDDREVNLDHRPYGRTNHILKVETGTHAFDLGTPRNYRPASQTRQVVDTDLAHPLEVIFEKKSRKARVR